MNEVNHFRRVVLWWLAASIVCTPVVVLLLTPGLPPGNGSVQSAGQVVDNTVLFGLSTPVALAVLVYFAYALIVFREREPAAALDGPPVRGDARIQTWWLVVTTGLVLFLAGYGTLRMLADGSGGGQGPNPIAAPADSGNALQVQVIAQQWKFTYRWPAYGGVETPTLELPAHRMIEFHVTSLDVIHSFWAYQLGVKADANPGFDNVAYVTTKQPLFSAIALLPRALPEPPLPSAGVGGSLLRTRRGRRHDGRHIPGWACTKTHKTTSGGLHPSPASGTSSYHHRLTAPCRFAMGLRWAVHTRKRG